MSADLPSPEHPQPLATLRTAAPGDVEEIAAIWHQGYRDGHLGYVQEEIFEFRRHEDFRARVPGLLEITTVAEVHGRVVGFVMIKDDELNQLYVDAAARGSGIAGALLLRGEEQIAARYDHGWLAVVAGNTRARRFYERAGWQEVGPIEQPSYAGPGRVMMIAALRYEKTLSR